MQRIGETTGDSQNHLNRKYSYRFTVENPLFSSQKTL